MARQVSRFDAESMKSEFAGAQLPDPRLEPRLESVVELIAGAPGSSYAKMSSNEAAREGLYRFVRNHRVDPDELLVPHQSATVERARRAGQVLVIHDTSEMRVADDAELDSWLTSKRRGFLTHASLVVDANQYRRPLGVLGLEKIERNNKTPRTKKNGRRLRGNETARLKNKEYDRWLRGVANAADLLSRECDVIHVMDAEADSYGLLAAIHDAGESFVVRLCHDRRARSETQTDWTRVRELLDDAKEFKRTRTVAVSKRRVKRAPQAAKAKPGRDERTAELTLSYTKVVIKRPDYLGDDLPKELSLMVVRATEKDPPQGVKPIDWVLLTNRAVASKAAVELVIDIYRQRWLIEEFFKALKTGCGFRKRKLKNPNSIYNSLSLLAPFAWRALLLRQLARSSTAPATRVFSGVELKVLRAFAKKEKMKLPAAMSASDALYYLAQVGGYRPSKKHPPGWECLIAGIQKLENLVEGWALFEAAL